jgi:hypothetical protein
MAQVRAAADFWNRADHVAAALAASFGATNLADHSGRARAGGAGRDSSTALVSRLAFAFDAAGILFQPDIWARVFVFVFRFHHHAAGLDFAADGKRSLAIEAARPCGELLASGERMRAVGPDVLKFISRCSALAATECHWENTGYCRDTDSRAGPARGWCHPSIF